LSYSSTSSVPEENMGEILKNSVSQKEFFKQFLFVLGINPSPRACEASTVLSYIPSQIL
jgi:hypothetical protein